MVRQGSILFDLDNSSGSAGRSIFVGPNMKFFQQVTATIVSEYVYWVVATKLQQNADFGISQAVCILATEYFLDPLTFFGPGSILSLDF